MFHVHLLATLAIIARTVWANHYVKVNGTLTCHGEVPTIILFRMLNYPRDKNIYFQPQFSIHHRCNMDKVRRIRNNGGNIQN